MPIVQQQYDNNSRPSTAEAIRQPLRFGYCFGEGGRRMVEAVLSGIAVDVLGLSVHRTAKQNGGLSYDSSVTITTVHQPPKLEVFRHETAAV